jgi:dissimilatory sulfite reductase (desulfoviridin) alpha/beta subunit
MAQKQDISVGELRRRGITKLKGEGMFAIWIKTACSNLTSKQLRKLAAITDKYARSYLLFTTRQIPIIPFVNINDVEKILEELSTVYLTLDRCGPTVRNVNVCYDDKICPEAVTNSLSLGEKLDNFFHVPMTHKVKLGVAGCRKDCITSRILTDIGFVGVDRDGKKGYDAYVGGRLGVNPFVGVKMAAVLSEEECARFVQNYFDLLSREGKKEERAADLINRLGMERVKQELNRDLQRSSDLQRIECETRLAEQDTGKMLLRIRATCGEVSADQLKRIADIAEKYGHGFVHFAVRGAPEIPGISREHLDEIRVKLRKVGMDTLDTGIDNLQSCFGSYCTEINVDPQSLLKRIEKMVEELNLNNLDIKISASGCPNSCGISHLNDIGFYGVVEPAVDTTRCNGCELCVPVCKRKAIEIRDGVAVIDEENCRHCGQCITVCPFNAIFEKRRGFAVLVGGRDGQDAKLGEVIAEFLSEEEALAVTRECLNLLKEKQASAATIIADIGIAEFAKTLVNSSRVNAKSSRGSKSL